MFKGFLHHYGGCRTLFVRRYLRSAAILAYRNRLEARIRFGAASRNPECALAIPIRIHYQSGRLCCETLTVTYSTQAPEANDLGLWMTRTSGNPKCRPQRSRIQSESTSLGAAHQVCPGYDNCRLKDSLQTLALVSFHKSTSPSDLRSASGPGCIALERPTCLGAL